MYSVLQSLAAPVVLWGSHCEQPPCRTPAEWQQHGVQGTVDNMFSPYHQPKLDPIYWHGQGGPGSDFATSPKFWACQ